MRYSISNTAEFGEYVSGPKIVTEDTKEEMRAILRRIQSGEFAEEFIADCRKSNDGRGGPLMKEFREKNSSHSIEKVGEELRSMMPWISKNKFEGALKATLDGADVIILDDGLQNYSLYQDLKILIVDGGFGFGNEFDNVFGSIIGNESDNVFGSIIGNDSSD